MGFSFTQPALQGLALATATIAVSRNGHVNLGFAGQAGGSRPDSHEGPNQAPSGACRGVGFPWLDEVVH